MIYGKLQITLEDMGIKEDDMLREKLLLATNTAIGELYTSRPVCKTVRFAARGQKPIFYCKERTGSPGETIVFPLQGRAFSVRIHGSCQFMIESGEESSITTVKTGHEAQVFKKLVTPGSKISFWGKYSYNLFDFSVYGMAYSEDESQIHDGSDIATFDLRKITEDFMDFYGPPRDKSGRAIQSFRLQDGRLEIDATYNGEVAITYRRMPAFINGLLEDQIDIPKEFEYIFPILVASHLLRDVDDDKAISYKQFYLDRAAEITSGRVELAEMYYDNLNNWA